MEQKSKVLTAVIALVTLVVGVFIGMGVNGGLGQGKLTWMQDKGSSQCEQYKSMLFQGTLTSTLGQTKATQVLLDCSNNYAAYWNAQPTLNECTMLKNRVDYYGVAGFSKFLTNAKLPQSNIDYCSKSFPFTWYGTGITPYECQNYKNFESTGADITKLLSGSSNKGNYGAIMKACSQLIGWPSTKPVVNNDLCVQYKKYAAAGTLSDMIKAGKAELQIAVTCSGEYPMIWNGVTKKQCLHYQAAQKQMMLTANLGSTQKASDAITACNYAGFNLFSPIP
ncbi:MAG: hypothetical protein NTZ25_02250 [Candidatus Peregrinibacteria bacterium]|nr:hypothetical protein [Candidatus Peregrinibacteria bacterium]